MASEKIDALELDITSKTSTENVDKLIDSLSRLSTELGKVKSKKVSVDIKQTGDASKSAATSVNKLSGSFLTQAIRITAVIALFRKLSGVIADGVANSATYIKSLNMFTVSLGEYADNATKYGEAVSDALGIDIASWQKTQGIFQTLITGFGVTGDKAAYMSQNITQLTYDIASFYGITNEEAANKLKAALSGRLEPIRKLGYDLSQSKLVDIAKNPANYGKQTFSIDEETGAIKANTVATDENTKHKIVNFNQLTQQEKVQLRYIALMTQVTQVQGNYARALNDPANQMNVFKQQLDMTSRALGNIFIPILNKTLPYLSAFAQLAKEAFQSLANLMGFELPNMKDRTDISKNVKPYNDVVKATGNAAKNAKKMKDYLLGIDELNVFNPNTGAGAGGASKGQNSNLKNLKLPGYDFLSKAVENSIAKAKAMLQKLAADFKKDPLLFTARILVEGASKLGEKIWEWLLGMSPEQLKAEAQKHGRTIGEEFWEQFKAGIKAKLGAVGADIWSVILGKSPDELKADAITHGTTVGTEFMNQLADRIDGQAIWEALWGTPLEFARKAQDAGKSVGEYFTTGLTTMLLKWSKTNPIFSVMYKMITGTDLDSVIAAYEAKLTPKKQESTSNSYKYVSYQQAKNLADFQKSQKQVEAAKKAGGVPAVDNSMNLANAKKAANDYINTYTDTIGSQKSKVQYAVTNGIFNPSIKGLTSNGQGANKYKYVSADQAKAYYSNFSSKETKTKVSNAAGEMGNAGVARLKKLNADYKNAGVDNTAGYIKGIKALLKEVGEAGADIGAKAINAAKKKVNSNSPSKEFEKIGMYSDQGFAQGVKKYSSTVTDSVSEMAGKALSTMRKASAMSSNLIMSGSVSVPTTSNAEYSVGASNENAMASLASNIYQAVVSGMASASIGNDNGGDIKVIIDGKEVFKAVQTESRKRGVAISNGAFSR